MTDARTTPAIRRAMCSLRDPESAAAALAEALDGPDATVFLFVSSTYDLTRLGPALKARFQSPVVGCTTAGELTPQGYGAGSICGFAIDHSIADVRLWPLYDLPTHSAADLVQLGQAVQEEARRARGAHPGRGQFGILLVDGMCGLEERVIGHLGPALPGIPVVGGSAGDDRRHVATHLLVDGRFEPQSALLAIFTTELDFAPVRSQNFEPSPAKLVITKATPEQRVVNRIDGRPAAEAYAAEVGCTVEALDEAVFSAHPLMLRAGGQYYVRSIRKVLDDGSLRFYCAIDEGLVLTVARSLDLVSTLADSLSPAKTGIAKPELVIGFECIHRRMEAERKDLTGPMGDLMAAHNVIGFHSYGEQADSVHINQTFTGIVLGGDT